MKTTLSFHSIIKVISRISLLILIASVLHILSIFNSLNSYSVEEAYTNELFSLKIRTLKLEHASHYQTEKIDSIIISIDKLFSSTTLLKPSWFCTKTLNDQNASLLTHWQKIKSLIHEQNYKNISNQFNVFSLSIDNIIKEHHILEHKKVTIMHTIEFMGILLILFCTYFLYSYSKKQITGPINKLISNTNSVKNKDFEFDFPSPNNEIGMLSLEMENTSQTIKKLLNNLEKQITEKNTQLEIAQTTIEFLFSISQQLGTLSLSSPILFEALNALAKHANLEKLSLELNDGTFINSSVGCAVLHPNLLRFNIIINNKTYGFINYVTNKNEPDHTYLIESFTGLVARALYQQELYSQNKKILLMEERNIIARELHDSIAQSLSFLKIQTTMLDQQIDNSQKIELKKTTGIIKETVSESYVQLRALLSTFRLTEKNSNFKDALSHITRELQKQTSAVISIKQFTLDFYVDHYQLPHILHILREAITNAIKHSQCTTIDIFCIKTEANKGWVSIIDNGLGIDNSTNIEEGYGLSIMKQRANKLKANFSISPLDQGTEIKLIFPSSETTPLQGITND